MANIAKTPGIPEAVEPIIGLLSFLAITIAHHVRNKRSEKKGR